MAQVHKCPHCGAAMKIPDQMMGRQLLCPFCKSTFAAPGAAAPRAAVPGAGAPASRVCPKCKAPLLPGAVACMDCGHLLNDRGRQGVQRSPSPVAAGAATPAAWLRPRQLCLCVDATRTPLDLEEAVARSSTAPPPRRVDGSRPFHGSKGYRPPRPRQLVPGEAPEEWRP